MRILFITTHPYLPLFYGGSEISTHHLAKIFLDRGHHVAVLSGLTSKNSIKVTYYRIRVKLASSSIAKDSKLGYPVYRCWNPEKKVKTVCNKEKPDVVIVQAGKQNPVALAAIQMNLPVIYYLRDLGFDFSSDQHILDNSIFIANSKFVAKSFHSSTGKTVHIVPPLVIPDYYINPKPGDNVLLVNPNHQKGVEVALQLAERCPDIPFIFVEGWGLPKEYDEPIRSRAAKLQNLKWLPSTDNMKEIYAQAKILLCPSGTPFQGQPISWIEAWGRVVSEAHFSGVPVIATKDGGLPESVGPGGILVEKDANIQEWEKALRMLWDDEELYQELSLQARKFSEREEFKPDFLAEKLINICKEVVEK